MPSVSMRQLLEAGVHFGHQTRRWNPKMKPYIFGDRNNVHIIDLAKETMTEVNLEKKTYSVLTFAEFSEAMKRLASKMSQGNAEGVQFKADVKQTGQKREISGYSAQGYLVTLTMDAKDKKSCNNQYRGAALRSEALFP